MADLAMNMLSLSPQPEMWSGMEGRWDRWIVRRRNSVAFLLSLVLHACALIWMPHIGANGRSTSSPGVLEVRWISDASAKPATVRAVRPEPERKMVRRVVRPEHKTILAAARASSDIVVPPESPHPENQRDAVSHIQAVPAARMVPASAPSAAPSPTPPSFSADYLSNPAPDYPLLSRQLREQGLLTLRVHVTTAGRADEVMLYRGSGFDRLDRSAVDAVKRWRFVPARLGGNAVDGWVLVPVRFVLKDIVPTE